MAEVSRPPPPKRPTIIRPKEPKDLQNESDDCLAPRRPPPKPPNRPPSFRKADAEEEKVQLRNPVNRPARPVTVASTGKDSGGKRKIEITIVSARPMSEVGFRDVTSTSNDTQTAQSEKPDLPCVVQKLSPPKSLVPDRSSLPPRPVKPAQVVRPAPPIPVRKDLPTPPDRSVHDIKPPASPTPKPRPHKPPPDTPPPKPPTSVPWQDQMLPLKPQSSLSSSTSSRPLPPTPLSEEDDPVPAIESPAKPERTFTWKNPEEVHSQPSSAVPSKPKRPTIIRPAKSKSLDKSVDEVDAQNQNSTTVPSVLDNQPTEPNKENNSKGAQEESNNTNTSPVKVKPPVAAKPKPTILPKPRPKPEVKENETNSDVNSSPDQNSDSNEIQRKIRKPTIIRANVPKLDNDNEETVISNNEIPEYASIHKTGHEKAETKPSVLSNKPPPPVPAKRFTPPVRKAQDDFEIQSRADEERVETRPKPTARARPMSMMVKTSSGGNSPQRPPSFLSPSRPPPPQSPAKPSNAPDTSKQKLADEPSPPSKPSPPVATRPEKPLPPSGTRSPKPPSPHQIQSISTPENDETKDIENQNTPPSRPLPVSRSKLSSHSEDRVLESEDKQEELQSPKPLRPKSVPHRPPQKPVQGKSTSNQESQKVSTQKGPSLPSRPGPGHPLYHYMLRVPHGLAVHDYEGSNPEDLSFKVNDIITLIKRIDDSWLLGQVGETTGIFPQNFIQILRPFDDEISLHVSPEQETSEVDAGSNTPGSDTAPSVSVTDKQDWIGIGPRCVARFDFDGEGSGDLCFEEGDYIRLVEKVDSEWFRGELHGKVGIFPLTFVEVIEDLSDLPTEYTLPQGEEPLGKESLGNKGSPNNPLAKHEVGHTPEESPKTESLNNVDSSLNQVPLMKHQEENMINYNGGSYTLCHAIADFHGDSPGDLGFHEGDIVEITGQIDEHWLRGRLKDSEGIFPASFVTIIENSSHTENDKSVLPEHTEVEETIGEALYDFGGENENELTFKTGDRIRLGTRVEGAEDWQWGELNGQTGMFPAAFIQEIS